MVIDPRSSMYKAWTLLDRRERLNSIKVLAVMIVGAIASATMIASVFPFLSVLSDPGLIKENGMLSMLYEAGNFKTDYDFLVALGIGSVIIIIISNFVLIIQSWALVKYTQMRIHTVSRRLLGHYLSQPYEYFLGRHSGDMSTNILSEAEQAVEQFLRPLAELISAVLTVVAVVATLIIVEPLIASITMGAFVGVYGCVTIITRRYVARMGVLRAQANERRFRIAGEALAGIKNVKLLGREASYLDRFSEPSAAMAHAQIGIGVLAQAPRFAIQMLAFGGIIVLCLLMLDPVDLRGREALGGILPLLGLLAFAGQRLMPELQKVYQSHTIMTSGAAALNRVCDDLSAGSNALIDRSRSTPLGLQQALTLDAVDYTYPGAKRFGLCQVSVTIQAGERIGVVGASGAGKTTLADVILGLLRPQTGTIQADGKKITQETMRAWQQTVGYVPQDIFLTDASLSENIALGLRIDEIDLAKVERVARIAQLHDFVMAELPNGYESRIGERGVRLSGGQRQRIGIARALYNDANLIVFDEATSALDNLTELEVISAINALPEDKTILMIAHRLTTVKDCDRIVMMENGKIADIGSWEELMANNWSFRTMAGAT